MADIKHSHLGEVPVEADGIHYRGIVWFVVVLVGTTLASQILVALLFGFLQRDTSKRDASRNPLAAPVGQLPPAPNLLTDEPGTLKRFRETEDKKLNEYSWISKSAGTVRMPIERAKELLIERGLPVGQQPPAAAPTEKPPAAAAKNSKENREEHEDHEDF